MAYSLLLICLYLLLYHIRQIFFTLFLEDCHLRLGLLKLNRHGLHLLPRVIDLEKAVGQLAHLLP